MLPQNQPPQVAPWLPPGANGGGTPDANSLLASLYPGQQPQQAAQPQPQHDSGNWLTRLLPTGGGLAGGAGGAALGTAILPGIGTILGGILGAGLGSAGAKTGENALEGKGLGNDVAREGIMGAGGQAVGGVLGKVGTKLIGKGLGALSGHVEGKAAANAASEAAANLSAEFPDAALNAATRKQLGFGGSIDLANKAGVPLTAKDFVNASNAATGSNGYLTSVLDTAARNGGKIDMSNFGKVVEEAIGKRPELGTLELAGGKGGLPKPAANTASTTKQLFENLLQKTGYGGTGSLENSAEPDAALDLLRQVGNLGSKYAGSAPGTEGDALKSVYDSVYHNLKGNVYGRPEVNAAVSAFKVSPEDADAVLKMAGGNQQLASHIIDIVNGAGRADDLLGPQAQFVNMGKAGQKASDYVANVVGTGKDAKAAAAAAHAAGEPGRQMGGMAVNGLLGKLGLGGAAATGNPLMLAAALPAVASSPVVKNAGTAILEKLTSGGVQKGVAKTLAPTLLGASQFLAHAPNYAPDQNSGLTGGAMDNQGGQPLPGQQPGGVSPNEQMLQMALVGMQNPLYASTFAPIVQQLMQGPIQQATSANTALQGAQSAFGEAGGGQGLLGGIMSKLGGAVTGGPASTYDSQRAQLISQLTALGIPTSSVPQLTNTPEAANSQWQTLQNLINAQGAGTGAGLLAGVGS